MSRLFDTKLTLPNLLIHELITLFYLMIGAYCYSVTKGMLDLFLAMSFFVVVDTVFFVLDYFHDKYNYEV